MPFPKALGRTALSVFMTAALPQALAGTPSLLSGPDMLSIHQENLTYPTKTPHGKNVMVAALRYGRDMHYIEQRATQDLPIAHIVLHTSASIKKLQSTINDYLRDEQTVALPALSVSGIFDKGTASTLMRIAAAEGLIFFFVDHDLFKFPARLDPAIKSLRASLSQTGPEEFIAHLQKIAGQNFDDMAEERILRTALAESAFRECASRTYVPQHPETIDKEIGALYKNPDHTSAAVPGECARYLDKMTAFQRRYIQIEFLRLLPLDDAQRALWCAPEGRPGCDVLKM